MPPQNPDFSCESQNPGRSNKRDGSQPLAYELFDATDAAKSTEVRLGLVLYGGISLAIYMNGICNELFRAVNGKGVYRLVKALADSDIVVDVISGSSAGGINGIALAYALANGKEFGVLARHLRELGDFDVLMHPTDIGRDDAFSLLDSTGKYQPYLEAAFDDLNANDLKREPGDDPSATTRLDLFITGTDVGGIIERPRDHSGVEIGVKDHRAVFRLKYRDYNKTDLAPDRLNTATARLSTDHHRAALSKLARITSCFPGAFEPVRVQASAPDDLDAWLKRWGALEHDAFYLDGGVLNNKPFNLTFEAIASNPPDRFIRRQLYYLEPSPTDYRLGDTDENLPMLQSIKAALIDLPGYESIRDDLNAIDERNALLDRYRILMENLHRRIDPPRLLNVPVETKPAATAQLSRMRSAQREQVATLVEESLRQIYRRARLLQLRDWLIDQFLGSRDRERPLRSASDRGWATALRAAFDSEMFTPGSPATSAELLRLDVHLPLRRSRHIQSAIYKALYEDRGSEAVKGTDPHRRQSLILELNEQIDRYRILRWAFEEFIRRSSIDWSGIEPARAWSLARNAALRLYSVDQLSPPITSEQSPSDLRAATGRRIDALAEMNEATLANLEQTGGIRTILEELDAVDHQLIDEHLRHEDGSIRELFNRFPEIDAHLFPIEAVGGLDEKDYVHYYRISPHDAQLGFSKREPEKKISGNQLRHFGSFLKRSWRSNDILWGRLDGTCRLIETLFDRERLLELTSTHRLVTIRSRLFIRHEETSAEQSRINPAMDPEVLFPSAGSETHLVLRTWLWEVVSRDASRRQSALEPARFSQVRELLIEAEQLETLHQELPTVIGDAVWQQRRWGSYQIDASNTDHSQSKSVRDPETEPIQPWRWKHAGEWIDPLLLSTSSHRKLLKEFDRIAAKAGAPARPRDTGVGRYFTESYHVGSETIRDDIPLLATLDLTSHAGLVFRAGLLRSLPEKSAAALESSRIFRFTVDLPLRVVRGSVSMARSMPGMFVGAFIGLLMISMLAIVIGTVWWRGIIQPADGFKPIWFSVFIVVPALTIVLQLRLLMWASFWEAIETSRRFRITVAIAIWVFIVLALASVSLYLILQATR